MAVKSKIPYVEYLDRFAISVDDLTVDQRRYLGEINQKLKDLEVRVAREVSALVENAKARIDDAEDWVEDYEIDCDFIFCLREDDPAYDEDDDNILVILNENPLEKDKNGHSWYGNCNHSEFAFSVRHPMYGEHHCWLYHCLYDHAKLGWVNVLRVGEIWVDVKISYQQFVYITKA